MLADTQTTRFAHHGNGFGFLRLVLASAVLVSHAQVLHDGTADREILARLFGHATLGEVAVDGFFAISGFLIAGSYMTSRSIGDYVFKRVARIYPAFIVASLLCVFAVAPLGGADLAHVGLGEWARFAKGLVTLTMPTVHAFEGQPYPVLNGSMWTISFEFRCYLVLILLGWLGLLRRPWALAAISAVLLLLFAFVAPQLALLDRLPLRAVWLGDGASAARLTGVFLAGAALYAWGDRIAYRWTRVAIAAVLTIVGLFIHPLESAAFALFGAYAVLGIGFLGRGTWLERVNNRNDISYGIYLYAWPITKLLLWFWPSLALLPLILLTAIGSCAAGWASWYGIERPVMEWARARLKSRRERPPAPPTGIVSL